MRFLLFNKIGVYGSTYYIRHFSTLHCFQTLYTNPAIKFAGYIFYVCKRRNTHVVENFFFNILIFLYILLILYLGFRLHTVNKFNYSNLFGLPCFIGPRSISANDHILYVQEVLTHFIEYW